MFLSVRSSKLYPRIRWCVSEANTVLPSFKHHRHWTRTPSHESSRFPSRSYTVKNDSNGCSCTGASNWLNLINSYVITYSWNTYTLIKLPSLTPSYKALSVWVPSYTCQAVFMGLTHFCPQFPSLKDNNRDLERAVIHSSCLITAWRWFRSRSQEQQERSSTVVAVKGKAAPERSRATTLSSHLGHRLSGMHHLGSRPGKTPHRHGLPESSAASVGASPEYTWETTKRFFSPFFPL